MAYAAEAEIQKAGLDNLMPFSLKADLMSAVTSAPVQTAVSFRRVGRRLCVVQVELRQEGKLCTQASVSFGRKGNLPPGEVWQPYITLPCPDLRELEDNNTEALYYTKDSSWSTSVASLGGVHQSAIWLSVSPIIGETVSSPFVNCAIASDVVNGIANSGTQGLQFINSDSVMTTVRPPIENELGLLVVGRTQCDAYSASTAYMYDRQGAFGMCLTSAMSISGNELDLNSQKSGKLR